jgi:hypothetical protein
MAKSTKNLMNMREIRIQELMSQGHDKNYIVEAVSKQFNVSPRGVQDQYHRIVAAVSKMVEENRGEIRANLMARNDHLYRVSLAEGKYKTALDANVAQAKLAGLNDRVEKEHKSPDVITITEADFSKGISLVGDKAENE